MTSRIPFCSVFKTTLFLHIQHFLTTLLTIFGPIDY